MTPVVAISREPAEAADPAQRAAIARLCAAAFLAYSSYAICRTPLPPLFARELGATAPTVGFVVAASTLTGIFLKLPAGTWSDVLGRRPLLITGALMSDRVGRRGLIVAGLSICGVAVFLVPMASSFLTLLPVISLYASGVAVTTSASSAYITDLARRAQYGAAHGVFGTIYDIGDALGPIAAGLLVAGVGYRWMFQTMACVTLIAAVVFHAQSRR
jgi:MFS family permease